MKTYQDFLAVRENDDKLKAFIAETIDDFKASDDYKTAVIAEEYYKNHNPDIMEYERFVYDLNGIAHKDMISPNHKIPQNYFFLLISQAVSYVLANGVSFANPDIKRKLGANFDGTLRKILTDAMVSKRSWGFYHDDTVDFIPYKQFVGLPDEFDSSIRAGIWFFQIDDTKPMSIRVYEEDGYTDYKRENGKPIEQTAAKRGYKVIKDAALGEETNYNFENYPTFPVVPLKNINDQSSIVGVLNILIALDMMYSKLVNNVSQSDIIYWVFRNYGGMSEADAEDAVIRLLKTHVIQLDGEGDAQPHPIEVPFEASQATIAQLRKLLFDTMMGVDVERIQAGNETATAIRAAYENLNVKEGLIEYELIEFILGIFRVAGIDETEEFHFTPNKVVNVTEEITNIIAAAPYLGDEAATQKICELLGMIDKFEDIQKAKIADAMAIAESEETNNENLG